jgi:hypothetical protein
VYTQSRSCTVRERLYFLLFLIKKMSPAIGR